MSSKNRYIKYPVLVLLMCAVLYPASTRAQVKGLSSLDFFVGEWDITNLRVTPDGEVPIGKSRSKADYVMDKTAIQDEFRALNPGGDVIFRGISIRSYNSNTQKIQVMWVVPGIKAMTDIEGEWIDGNIVTNAKGYDGRGPFLEKLIYYNISDSTYSARLDRSYDNGITWIEYFGRFDAKKRK